MARWKPGTRVGAICSAGREEVRFYGWGVYVGDEIGGPMGEFPNPKIQLDDGGVVWGCECWWGSEDQVRQMIGVRKVVIEPAPDRAGMGERDE